MTKNEAYQKAAGEHLTDYLPDNWEEMEEDELFLFLEEHAWEPFEYYTGSRIWEMITESAENLLEASENKIKENKEVLEEGVKRVISLNPELEKVSNLLMDIFEDTYKKLAE